MPRFIVNNTFQFGGEIRRAGSILTISKADLEKEFARGMHPKNGKYLSGLLIHCEPDDDGAAVAVAENVPQDDAGDEEAERIATIRSEMDEMGAAYDRRWKLPRLENELVMAKKTRGL